MSESRPYHHGNLRAELIAAALKVTRQHGHEAISLRALAEDLGVSRGAPYRHFPDRESLLTEVALHGFQALEQHLKDSSAETLTAAGKLRSATRRFLAFARSDPKVFRVMYEAQLLTGTNVYSPLAESQRRTYQGIDYLFSQALPGISRQARQLRLITMWSTVYGFAKICQTGILQPYMRGGLTEDEIEEAIVQSAIGALPEPAPH